MLLHSEALKTNFYPGKPSDEANQLNQGMVKTFMSFSQPAEDSNQNHKIVPIMYTSQDEHKDDVSSSLSN